MSKLIDYTQMRRNSKVGPGLILVCPTCKKRGLSFNISTEVGDLILYVHTSEKTLEGKFNLIDYHKVKK